MTKPGHSDAATELWHPVARHFYQRPPTAVAPELLNKIVLRSDGRAGRIVEVEAYAGEEDPAAHSFKGVTPRCATMFGEAGCMYVYLSYGMHWCSNVVCGEVGQGWAVLFRALEPMAGMDLIKQARPAIRRERDLMRGPGRLASALGIDKVLDGADLVTGNLGISVVSDGVPPPVIPTVGKRIGISKAVDYPWRWHVAGNPYVSK